MQDKIKEITWDLLEKNPHWSQEKARWMAMQALNMIRRSK